MDMQDIPLLKLFLQVKEAGLPLGLEEYFQVLYALQEGISIADNQSDQIVALQRLCHTLWVKTADEQRLFDSYFERLVQQVLEHQASSTFAEESSEDEESPLAATLFEQGFTTSDANARMEYEIEMAPQAIQTTEREREVTTVRSLSSSEYFPVTRRQMKQSWRYLRRPVREGMRVELDIEATVREIGRTGTLLEPVLVPARVNRAELIVLIDHNGSMVPFHILTRRLTETILYGGNLGKVTIYYFHNCPNQYLYRDIEHQEYETLEKFLYRRYSQRAGVLIFSDAGAARGNVSAYRITATKNFLAQLKKHFRSIAWLNPVPHTHWPGTTAEGIWQDVSMFEFSRRGLDDAISLLRGRPAPGEYSLRRKYHE